MGDIHFDFETRSRADIKAVGAYRYAEDPSTRVFMCGVAEDDGPVRMWINPDLVPAHIAVSEDGADALMRKVSLDESSLLWAHNVGFENAIMRSRAEKDLGIRRPSLKRLRCTAALSRKAGFPSGLDDATRAMQASHRKDSRGTEFINLFCIPDKKTGLFNAPEDFPEEFRQFIEYCRQDVEAERAIHRKLKAFTLNRLALETFQFDLEMNERGVPVNVPGLKKAAALLRKVLDREGAAFFKMTGLKPTQREKVKMLLFTEGLDLPDMKAPTIEDALEREDLTPFARKVLEAYADLNYAAAKKVFTMLDCVCADGRVRGAFIWHGARTGRWTATLIQPQNFKKATVKWSHIAFEAILDGWSVEDIAMVFGPPLEVISLCIRHFIQLPLGDINQADYAAIEARVTCWIAGQEDALERYRKDIDSYLVMTSVIYGEQVTDKEDKRRQLGKETVLGCGFGMGVPKFLSQCHKKGLTFVTLKLAERAVGEFRSLYHMIPKLWRNCEKAAISAMKNFGTEFTAGPFLRFKAVRLAGIPYLTMTLPSGRALAYPFPELRPGKYGDAVTYMGTVKGKWVRIELYGGKFVENAAQAIAADLMGFGAVNADRDGFLIFALIHDEALSANSPTHTPERFAKALALLPGWAKGLPLVAEPKLMKYYRK